MLHFLKSPCRAPTRLKAKSTEKLKRINEAYDWILTHPSALDNIQKKSPEQCKISCPNCSRILKIPEGLGIVYFTCPQCEKAMQYDSDSHEFIKTELEIEEESRKKREK